MVKVDFGFIDSVLQKYGCDKTRVIAIMQEIQNEYKFLPKDALKYIAEKIGESEAELYGVATFYENFSMNEKGKYIIKVCNRLPRQKVRRCSGSSLRRYRSYSRGAYVQGRTVYHRARLLSGCMRPRAGLHR